MSLSELTPIIFVMELTHLGLEASIHTCTFTCMTSGFKILLIKLHEQLKTELNSNNLLNFFLFSRNEYVNFMKIL